MKSGIESLLYEKAQDDKEFNELYQRILHHPDKYTYNNTSEGLKLLKTGQNVIFTISSDLNGYFKANPFESQNLKLFGGSKSLLKGIIFPKNCPLTPIFKYAMLKLDEGGTFEFLQKKWMGSIPIAKSDGATILSFGQVILIIIILSAAVGLSLLVLLCEILSKMIR